MVETYRNENAVDLFDLHGWKEDCAGEYPYFDEDEIVTYEKGDSKRNYLEYDVDDYEQRMETASYQYPDEDIDGDYEEESCDIPSNDEFITPCGEIVAENDQRLKRARKVWERNRDNDVYVNNEGQIVYKVYDSIHKRHLNMIYTPKTEREKELVKLYDEILKEQEKDQRKHNENTDAVHSLNETDEVANGRVDDFLLDHAVAYKGNQDDAFVIRPEAVLIKLVQDECLTSDQHDLCFDIYSAQDMEKGIAENDSVTPQAICNRNSRMKSAIMRGFSEYGVNEDNLYDYEAQTESLRERVFSMPEDTAGGCLEKYRAALRLDVRLDKRRKAFEKSLKSGYQDLEGKVVEEIILGREANENLIIEIRELMQRLSVAIEQILGSLSDERYVTVIRMNKLEGCGMDEVAAAVGLGRRGAEKMRDRAMKEAEAVYQEVLNA